MAKSFWKKGLKSAGKGVQKGLEKRVENKVAGSGGGGSQPFQGSTTTSASGGIKWGWIILIVVLFVIVTGAFTPIGAECIESGYCRTRIIEPVKDSGVVEAVQDATKFVGRQATQTRSIVSGEQTFSWDSDVEEGERSGVWFDNERAYGINLGETEKGVVNVLNSEFGAITDIVVGKMDENIKVLKAELECSLENEIGTLRGLVSTFKTNEINLFPPLEGEKTRLHGPNDCVFTQEQATRISKETIKGQTYFSEDIVFNLTYSLNPFVTLPVFVIQDEETYNGYRGRLGEAFEDLAEGAYDEFSRGVNSKIQFDTDVQAIIQILDQPIYSKEGALLGVQFRNKDIKNQVVLNKFSFVLPSGLSISAGAKVNVEDGGSCDWFRSAGTTEGDRRMYELDLNEPELIRNLKDLNGGIGDTRPFLCKVEVDSSVLRDVDLLNLGEIEGQLDYEYTISEIVKVSN